MNKALTNWMRAATAQQKSRAAELLKLASKQMLRHWARGVVGMTAGKAIDIERALRRVPGAADLPLVRRTDLCDACRRCDYARRCQAEDSGIAK